VIDHNLPVALALAASGLPVFPCDQSTEKPRSKRPLVDNWPNRATNAENGVRHYWATRPGAIVGVQLGKSGLVVLDLDVGHADGKDGVAEFEAILDHYGGSLDGVPVVRTWSGGYHCYYRQPMGRAPLGNREGMLADSGINVRGAGGYVIAPGSVMDTGEYYECVAGWPDLAEAFVAGAIPEIPGWLVELIEWKPPESERVPSSLEPVATDRARKWALGALDKISVNLTGAAKGSRNIELNNAVYTLAGKQAIGRLVLIASVRRARRPGTKFDQIVVLESVEGFNKSTAIKALAGGDEFFSDAQILGLPEKDQMEKAAGVWLYEIADLTGMRKSDVDSVKAFASRTHDRARPAYGRFVVNQPRRCSFWATTNETDYLKSQTGNRRFWPVKVGRVDIESLMRDRDLLWAEAAYYEGKGASIMLPENLWGAAAEQQDARREADPWEDALSGVAGQKVRNETGGIEERILTETLFGEHLIIDMKDRTTPMAKRLGQCMRILGWFGPKMLAIFSDRGRGYWRPTK
jgi:hypothetical protein